MLDFKTPLGALRVTENDVARPDFQGGRVILTADNHPQQSPTEDDPEGDRLSEDEKITQITVMINFRKNGPMANWPTPGDGRRLTLHITEEPATS